MTENSADHSGRWQGSAPTADDLFRGSAVVQSAEDLAADGVFDDEEMEEFLADLAAMRRADLA